MHRIIGGAAIMFCLATAVAEAQENRRVFVGTVAGVSTQARVIYVPRHPAASFSARSASGQLEWAISTA